MEKNEPRYPVERRRTVVVLPPVGGNPPKNPYAVGKMRKSPFGTAFSDKNRSEEKS